MTDHVVVGSWVTEPVGKNVIQCQSIFGYELFQDIPDRHSFQKAFAYVVLGKIKQCIFGMAIDTISGTLKVVVCERVVINIVILWPPANITLLINRYSLRPGWRRSIEFCSTGRTKSRGSLAGLNQGIGACADQAAQFLLLLKLVYMGLGTFILLRVMLHTGAGRRGGIFFWTGSRHSGILGMTPKPVLMM